MLKRGLSRCVRVMLVLGAGVGRVSVLGTMSGAYEADGSNVFDVKFIGILTAQKHSAGSVCASFTANNNPKYADQVVFGHFELLGGTGPAARVRGSGNFLSIQARVRTRAHPTPQLTIRLGFKHLSLGHSRGLSKACRASVLPPPAVSVTLKGFAFGPVPAKPVSGSVTDSLPPGTTIYPNGSTVTGTVGCTAENNLYAVLNYSGPNGAQLTSTILGSAIGRTGGQVVLNPGPERRVLVCGTE